MAPKRKLRASSPANKGLAPGQVLKRGKLAGNAASPWAWVGSEVKEPSQISQEHRLMACGLSARNDYNFCRNKFLPKSSTEKKETDPDDLIVISDDEEAVCTKRSCKSNPNCLNHIDIDCWLDADETLQAFSRAIELGDDPHLNLHEPDIPVGLKNLGATCYANASLQVWFRDAVFRNGVYSCRPAAGEEVQFKSSPLYQLQVTFAALQNNVQNAFNPIKLVESLKLRTSEQQDAQEFSKLFMSHLDTEFKRQTSPALRSLVEDQFQGKQVYGTMCDKCNYKSERSSDFLEIEINFKNKARLEDCISASLQEEKLTEDNKYFCPRCDSHQDATRYTELRQLPPVLHFSLLRFVYDFDAMERRKSKNCISFPLQIDMGKFIKDSNSTEEAGPSAYQLQGVLLHKGSSAYHGHYEAQVYDVRSKSWYQFNDETVTRIKNLGKPPPPEKGKEPEIIEIDGDDDKTTRAPRPKRKGKRRRVDDSDEEVEKEPPPTSSGSRTVIDTPSEISSRDAYMLIYARKEHRPVTEDADVSPSEDVLQVVKDLNAAFEEECEAFSKRKKAISRFISRRRQDILDIIHSWNVSSINEESYIVGKAALETWLEHDAMMEAANAYQEQTNPNEDVANPSRLSLDSILCKHEKLNPSASELMKRISKSAFHKIENDTKCVFDKKLTVRDVCKLCTEDIFKEALYDLQHPHDVSLFESFAGEDTSSCGYWISKAWIKDWKLAKPKMHIWSMGDPAPDSADFKQDVICEHDELSLKTISRRLISVQACEVLTNIFPSWRPLSSDAPPCYVCSAMVKFSSGDKLELRKKAENEKAILKGLLPTDPPIPAEGDLLALVPCEFLKAWRSWIHRPTDLPRPEELATGQFLCEHGHLVFDPNCSTDMEFSITMVLEEHWIALQTCYGLDAEPILLTKQKDDTFSHELPVCQSCRNARKRDWETTQISIRFGRKGSEKAVAAVSTRKVGARQSKRLRQVREHGERRRITITKSTAVKDIKLMVEKEFQIPIMLQRLYHDDKELSDSAATVSSLNILADDVLELEEHKEVFDISDTDEAPEAKRQRREGNGFGGTLLSLSAPGDPVQPTEAITKDVVEKEEADHDLKTAILQSVAEKACGACTFANIVDATECAICYTLF